ncbi:tachykinin-like peptides receptor 99D [Dermacentor albipictus]|uniref:tachykinin-like peptides receptor 99D n=1 Tax=Dermacentor albipictus TaxID=60249 RepID=UPI0031FC1C0E
MEVVQYYELTSFNDSLGDSVDNSSVLQVSVVIAANVSEDVDPAANGSGALSSVSSSGSSLYEVPVDIVVLLSFCYGLVSLVSILGNVLVLWIVASSRRMQTITNLFIANLAVADVIIGVFSIPFQFQAALLQRWALPYFMCAFCPYVQVVSVNVSVFTLTAIAVERYRAITSPLKARFCSKATAKLLVLFIWLSSLVVASPNALALRVVLVVDKLSGLRERPFCANVGMRPFTWKAYNHALVCAQYFLPLSVICFTYGKIWKKLRQSKAPGNMETVRDANIVRNKNKVIKMMVIVVVTFALCWLPYQTYNLLAEIYPAINSYRYINVIWFCMHWLAMSNSCYNPFIYAIYSEKFSAEFKARMSCCLKRKFEDSAFMASSIISQVSFRIKY